LNIYFCAINESFSIAEYRVPKYSPLEKIVVDSDKETECTHNCREKPVMFFLKILDDSVDKERIHKYSLPPAKVACRKPEPP
jgi:hypothetical protein